MRISSRRKVARVAAKSATSRAARHDGVARGAADELRSTNAQSEFLLRRALAEAGRLPSQAGPMRRPGRPRGAGGGGTGGSGSGAGGGSGGAAGAGAS